MERVYSNEFQNEWRSSPKPTSFMRLLQKVTTMRVRRACSSPLARVIPQLANIINVVAVERLLRPAE
jgi:hypothetical protein